MAGAAVSVIVSMRVGVGMRVQCEVTGRSEARCRTSDPDPVLPTLQTKAPMPVTARPTMSELISLVPS